MVKTMRLCLCGLFMILLAGSYVKADPQELNYVRQAIAAKGARWRAAETSVSKLSPEERRMRLGLVKSQMPNAPLLAAPAASSAAALPATFSWQNYNGQNFVTPVRNQGNCGSCWAFATTANLESVTLIKNGTPLTTTFTDFDLSEQALVSCGGAGSCSGGSPGSASNYIKNTGLPPESCDPYTATNGACPATCQQPYYKIASWSYVTTTAPTVDAIKNALNTYGPLNTTMEVYNDFFYYSTGAYHYTSGNYAGAHAILIVGYDDSTQSFICKNSWGSGWGEQGFFNIAYSELTSVTQFGYYTIAYQAGSTPPPSCTYSVSQPTSSYDYTGGKGSSSVTTDSACTWTASASPGWITITAGKSGTGNGTVAFTVAANTTTATRTANLSIAGKTFTITQSGAPTFTITTSAGANGTISPVGPVNVVGGTSQTFKITPAAGYKIASVVVDSNSVGAVSSYTFTNVTATHSISASFAAATYTLTVSKKGTGSGTVASNPTGPTYSAGTSVVLTATAGAKSTFAGWSGACSGKLSTCTLVMNNNAAVLATFSAAR
ncbi:MAG TPA: C1 family peptidase [Syntrophorhabdales bacterium]|nr:C1 family peptidase [Syntrophorhabdales bacterium]